MTIAKRDIAKTTYTLYRFLRALFAGPRRVLAVPLLGLRRVLVLTVFRPKLSTNRFSLAGGEGSLSCLSPATNNSSSPLRLPAKSDSWIAWAEKQSKPRRDVSREGGQRGHAEDRRKGHAGNDRAYRWFLLCRV